jgi:WD40 repeat protein
VSGLQQLVVQASRLFVVRPRRVLVVQASRLRSKLPTRRSHHNGLAIALVVFILQAAGICLGGEPSPKPPRETSADAPQKIPIADLRRTQPVNFETEILPLLAKNCLACHKSQDPENDLVLETPETIRKGGEHGSAVVPGQSGQSRLLQLASHEHNPIMPPVDNKVAAAALSSEQLGLIKAWIDQGAQGSVGTIARAVHRQPLPSAAHPILALAIAPDDDYVACSRGDKLAIYDLRGPRRIAELVDPALAASGHPGAAHEDLIRSLAFARQGDVLASGGFRTVKLWRRPHGALEREIAASLAGRTIAVSPTGMLLALGLQTGAIELHDPTGKQPAKPFPGKHDSAVTGLAFASDGSRLYSAGLDKTIRVWDVATGTQLGKQNTPAEVRALAVLPSGNQIATGEADNVIRIWNISNILKPPSGTASAPAVRELKGHNKPIAALAIVLGGRTERLLSGSEDGHARLWNPATGESPRDFEHGAPVTAVAASADGRRVLSVGANGVARLWNPDDGALIADIKQDPRAARSIARADGAANYAKTCIDYRKEEFREAEETVKRETTALEDAKKSKTADEKAVVDKTSPAEKAVAARIAAEAKAVEAAAAFKIVGDKMTAAKTSVEQADKAIEQARKAAEQSRQAAEKDKSNKDLTAARQAAEKTLQEAVAAKPKADAAFSQATAAFREAEQKNQQAKNAANDAADRAKQPERELQEAKNTLQGATSFITTATIVADRAKAAVPIAQQAIAKAEAAAKLRDEEKNKLIEAAKTQKPLQAAAFSADGRFVAIAGQSPGVRLYDALHGTAVEVLEGLPEGVVGLAFGADGKLVSADADQKLRIWSTPGPWKLERTIGSVDDPSQLVDRVLSLDFSADGKLLATGGGLAARSGELKLWNVADGKLVREISGAHRDTIFGVKFSPDGQYLATASADRLLKVFRVADGSLVRTFEGHSHHVLGVAWEGGGHLLATCGGDRVVKLWNFDTGAPLRTMRGDSYLIGEYKGEISSIAFIGNTEHLLVSSGDHTVRMHRTSSDRDVRCFKEGASFMHAAVASSDGKLILGGGHDGILHLWNGENGYPIPLLEPTGNPAAAAQKAAAK